MAVDTWSVVVITTMLLFTPTSISSDIIDASVPQPDSSIDDSSIEMMENPRPGKDEVERRIVDILDSFMDTEDVLDGDQPPELSDSGK